MPLYTPHYVPTGYEIAVIKTEHGDIRVRLAGNDAPITVGNFIELARKGFYNRLKFHRFVTGFVVQGGCPHTRYMKKQEVIESVDDPEAVDINELEETPKPIPGTGDPGYNIRGEWTTNPNNRHYNGSIAMARNSDPNSAGSQFYFSLGDQPSLDSAYTVFGQAMDAESLEIIHKLWKGDEIKTIEIYGGL